MCYLFIIVICLPYFITVVVQGDFLNNDEKIEQNKDAEENTERLVLIVANEIPLNYEKEALKAQAVIARTNLVYAKKNGLTEPESVSKENLREILGTERYQKKYELIKECVEETKGKIVTYQGDEVYLPYHFVSAGFTRNAKKSDKKEQPYLKSVQSAADYQSDYFLKTIFL